MSATINKQLIIGFGKLCYPILKSLFTWMNNKMGSKLREIRNLQLASHPAKQDLQLFPMDIPKQINNIWNMLTHWPLGEKTDVEKA